MYINYKLTNDNPNETAKIVEKLATEHFNLKALCTSIHRLLQIVRDMKKHLSRAWDDIVCIKICHLDFHLIIPKVHAHIQPFHCQFILYTAVNQALPVSCQLSLDQTAVIVEIEEVQYGNYHFK